MADAPAPEKKPEKPPEPRCAQCGDVLTPANTAVGFGALCKDCEMLTR